MNRNFGYYELVNIWRQLPENTFNCGVKFATSLKCSTNAIIRKLLHKGLIKPVKKESSRSGRYGTYERNVYVKAEYGELSRSAKKWLKKINFCLDHQKFYLL